MNGFFARLISRSAGVAPAIRPRISSFFGAPERSAQDLNDKVSTEYEIAPIEQKSFPDGVHSKWNRVQSAVAGASEVETLHESGSKTSPQVPRFPGNDLREEEQTAQSANRVKLEMPLRAPIVPATEPKRMPSLDAVNLRRDADVGQAVPTASSNQENVNELDQKQDPEAIRELPAGLPRRKGYQGESEVLRISPLAIQVPSIVPASSHASQKSSETVIQISIGRVEIKATPATTSTVLPSNKPSRSSLDDYQLRREQRGRR